MNQLVILNATEQEYLLRIIEASLQVRDLRQLFLWSQGQLQALLPHQLMVCMQFGPDGALERLEALHGSVQGDRALARLCDPQSGLAVRLARHGHDALLPGELAACGYDNVLLDGSGPVAGGATVFALFGLPVRPDARHAYFLGLLLPQLHLALVRLAIPRHAPGIAPGRGLSARETDIVHWLRAGKRNDEIGALLGLSALTVKNHLSRIYKLLGVRNRTEAVARCASLRLLADQRRVAATAH
jgi:DNA-binding CsgD family transcriptional regulator